MCDPLTLHTSASIPSPWEAFQRRFKRVLYPVLLVYNQLYFNWHPAPDVNQINTNKQLTFQHLFQRYRKHSISIPTASTKLKGWYTGLTLSVCPFVRLSLCGQNRVRSVSTTIHARWIWYLHILSSIMSEKCFSQFEGLTNCSLL